MRSWEDQLRTTRRATLLFQIQADGIIIRMVTFSFFLFKKKKEKETLPFTSMWTVWESERPCLFFAVHVYAPWSVLLSTWCSTSVPFGNTSWRRLVGNTFPSVGSEKTFSQHSNFRPSEPILGIETRTRATHCYYSLQSRSIFAKYHKVTNNFRR